MKTPLVSIVIPTYGRSDRLCKTVQSVLNQTYDNVEIIIIDDNGLGTPSQVETEKKLNSYIDEIVSYYPSEKNHGGSYSRNKGASFSKGEYICFLDDDDFFYPEKISRQVQFLESHLDYLACYCGHVRHNEITGEDTIYNSSVSGNILLPVLLFEVDVCSGSTLMVRRECFKDLNGFTLGLSRFQDYEFLVRLAHKGKIGSIEEPLVQINTHEGSNKNRVFEKDEKDRMAYLQAIKYVIDELNPTDKKKVEFANNSYLMASAVKLHNLKGFVKYFFKCGINKRTFCVINEKAKKMLK